LRTSLCTRLDLGGIDLSPVVLIIGLVFFRMLVFEVFGTVIGMF
jgi:uncharacterized protein YggT (Ycf19 family)